MRELRSIDNKFKDLFALYVWHKLIDVQVMCSITISFYHLHMLRAQSNVITGEQISSLCYQKAMLLNPIVTWYPPLREGPLSVWDIMYLMFIENEMKRKNTHVLR